MSKRIESSSVLAASAQTYPLCDEHGRIFNVGQLRRPVVTAPRPKIRLRDRIALAFHRLPHPAEEKGKEQ